MSKRLGLVCVLFLLAALAASAGDVAQFVNLGFSKDARYFMFGQYGISERDSTPWADAFIVDVRANSFAPKGTKRIAGTQPVDPGSSGLGALLNALADGLPQSKRFKIDHLATGRLLYILLDGAQAADSLEFRDFQSGRSYTVVLTQSSTEKDLDVSSTFSIAVTVTEKDGTVRSFAVGDPVFKRNGVRSYHIKQIILAPDGASLVFIVQKEERDTRGNNVRYMVETARPK